MKGLSSPEEDEKFPQDELFFSSTDPLTRQKEQRRHPDTGERVLIVSARSGDWAARQAAIEARDGLQVETVIQYYPSAEPSKN